MFNLEVRVKSRTLVRLELSLFNAMYDPYNFFLYFTTLFLRSLNFFVNSIETRSLDCFELNSTLARIYSQAPSFFGVNVNCF